MQNSKENTELLFLYKIKHIPCQYLLYNNTFSWNFAYFGCHGQCYQYTLFITQIHQIPMKHHSLNGNHGNDYLNSSKYLGMLQYKTGK